MAEQEKKLNVFVRAGGKISKWARELKSETKKIVWPTRNQVINNTIIVLICILLVGIFIWALDFALGFIRDFLLSLK